MSSIFSNFASMLGLGAPPNNGHVHQAPAAAHAPHDKGAANHANDGETTRTLGASLAQANPPQTEGPISESQKILSDSGNENIAALLKALKQAITEAPETANTFIKFITAVVKERLEAFQKVMGSVDQTSNNGQPNREANSGDTGQGEIINILEGLLGGSGSHSPNPLMALLGEAANDADGGATPQVAKAA